MDGLTAYQLTLIALGAIGFGIWLLVKGGDVTIASAVRIAESSGLSKLFIAATIVAFGTSAPELFTSVNANLSGFPGISVGNVIGSNIANVLMVIGVSAVIAPVLIDRKEVRVDTGMMIIATIAMAVAVWAGILPNWAGLAMIGMIVAYVFYQYKASRIEVEEDEDAEPLAGNPYVLVTVGITTLVVGSEILVQGAVAGGYALGVPEAVIGMTVIAFGTSLPELTACVAAARKGQSDMIVGGIVGSNIFNILSVMAISAAVKPLLIEPRFAVIDLPVVLAVTAIFAVFLLVIGRIGRTAGIVMVAGYLVFIAVQYGWAPEVQAGLVFSLIRALWIPKAEKETSWHSRSQRDQNLSLSQGTRPGPYQGSSIVSAGTRGPTDGQGFEPGTRPLFMLGESGKVRSDADFIFYNQKGCPAAGR